MSGDAFDGPTTSGIETKRAADDFEKWFGDVAGESGIDFESVLADGKFLGEDFDEGGAEGKNVGWRRDGGSGEFGSVVGIKFA